MKIPVDDKHVSIGVHAYGPGGTVSCSFVCFTPDDAEKLKAAILAVVDPQPSPWNKPVEPPKEA